MPHDPSVPINIVKIPIDGLRPHPRQAEFFGDIAEAELQLLASDIDEHGQREPIHVLTDGTILTGHQRIRALKLLGRTTVRAIVRSDLAGKVEAATEFFLTDNLNRRHLDPLAIARCCYAIREILNADRSARGMKKSRTQRAAILAKLAAIGCNISGRTLDRYYSLLGLPRPIQDAISAKRLAMRDGFTLLQRSTTDIKIIADACAEGKSKAELAKLMRQIFGKPRKLRNCSRLP